MIYLDDETIDSEINRMKDTVVKYQLIENGNEKVDLVSELGTSPFRILTSGVIGGNITNTYSLRFWIKGDAEVSTNQIFNVKLRIIATSKEAISDGKLVFGDTIITSDNGVTSMTSDELQNYIDKVSENKIESILNKEGIDKNTAEYHNSIFRGKDVTNYYEDGSLYERISSGRFEDLYVGDYIRKNDITWRIAGFDIYLNKGSYTAPLTSHHVVIIPDHSLMLAKMNDTDTTEGSYVGSKMYKEVLPNILDTIITPIFGDHILEYSNRLTNFVNKSGTNQLGDNSGCTSQWSWYNGKLNLMNEVQMTGTVTFSSSGYEVGTDNVQFPLFRLAPEYLQSNVFFTWLRSVASNTNFCVVYQEGVSSHVAASNSEGGIRPYFYIG